MTKSVAMTSLLIGLAACDPGAGKGFSAKDAGLQAVALGGLSTASSDMYVAFAERHGPDAGRILQERYDRLGPTLDLEAMTAYEEVFSKEELEYIGRMYGTKQGREILQKYHLLYPRLSVIGERYAAKAMAN